MQTHQTNRLLTRCCGLLESLHRSVGRKRGLSGRRCASHQGPVEQDEGEVNKATVLMMNENTWYLDDQHYDAIVEVLGKVDVAAAKENWPLYITVVGMAEVAARNHRAETGTNITKEFADKWYYPSQASN
ncbi:TPA: hypothetical protein ACH3X2_002566 [Trebouxia sp. C0005]